jgi:hypothetical protein
MYTPSSKGVSSGPKMTAFQIITLSGHGAPDTPSGGSVCSLLKSLINLRLAVVDILGNFEGLNLVDKLPNDTGKSIPIY